MYMSYCMEAENNNMKVWSMFACHWTGGHEEAIQKETAVFCWFAASPALQCAQPVTFITDW